MPISVTGTKPIPDERLVLIRGMSADSRGFSFIELLVAVLIIVLLTGVVTLNVGRGGADLRLADEARYVANLLEMASTEAGLSASDHGLLVARTREDTTERYQGIWLQRFDQGWASPRVNADIFAPLDFEAGTELVLTLDGQPDIEIEKYNPELNPTPQIVAWAGGEMTPGVLEWIDQKTGEILYRLEWDLLGRMTLLPRGEAEVEVQ